MNPETYAIAEFETTEDAKAAGYTTMLSAREAAFLRNAFPPPNRKDRRAALSRARKVQRAE